MDDDSSRQQRRIDVPTLDLDGVAAMIAGRRNEWASVHGLVAAHVAVAVSSTGFTSGAVDKAAAKGIELRTVDEVEEQDVARWMGGVVYDYRLVSLGVRVGAATTGSSVTMRLDGRNFVRISDGSELTMFEAFPPISALQLAANRVPAIEANGRGHRHRGSGYADRRQD